MHAAAAASGSDDEDSERMKRLPYIAALLITAIGIGTAGYYVWSWTYTTSVPFEYNPPLIFAILVKPMVQGKQMRFTFMTGAGESYISSEAVDALKAAGAEGGFSSLTADTSLGGYCHRQRYKVIEPRFLPPVAGRPVDGMLGGNFITSTGSLEDSDRKPPLLQFDFKEKILTIDWHPQRSPLNLPAGTIRLPMHQDYDGDYSVSLRVNGRKDENFMLDESSPVGLIVPWSLLPGQTGKGLKIAQRWTAFPVSLNIGGRVLKVRAWVSPDDPEAVRLGPSLLARYRVTIDYAESVLYLSPP
jgi:hypothetical protein